MKKCLLILCLSALWAIPALAQVPAQQEEKPDPAAKQAKMQQIENLKIAYISQQLNLSPDEAKQFWPIYFQYEKEVKGVNSTAALDEISREEAILNIRKRYHEQFTQVLGRNRSTYFFQSERNFNQMLMKRLYHTPPPGAHAGMRKGGI